MTTLSWLSVPAFAMVSLSMIAGRYPLYLYRHQYAYSLLLLGIAIAMALPLGWASRRPVPVLGVMLVEAIGLRLYGERSWPVFLVVDVLVFYIRVSSRRRLAEAAAAAVLVVWCIVYLPGTPSAGILHLFKTGPGYLVVGTTIAWILGSWIRLRQDHAEMLQAQAATQAVQAERLRIARELHDMVAHSIGVIAIQAGAAGRVIETQPKGARAALGVIEATSRETLAGLRRMLIALREADSDPEQTAPIQGLKDLDWLTETTAKAGVKMDVRWQGQQRPLPPEVDLSAFRIVQESVTNVVRHAGVSQCCVLLDFREKELSIEVVDDGQGGPAGNGGSGYGILGMRERVGLLHGSFRAGPRPEGGFRVAVRLPL